MLWVERLRDSHQKVKVKVKWIYIAPSRETSKGVFIATQLNSTQLNWRSWTAYSQASRVFVYDVTTYKLSQLGHYVHW